MLAAVVQLALLPHPSIAPFVFFYFTVALVSWLAGRGPGLLAVALSALVADFLFISPSWQWARSGPALTAIGLFVVSAGAVALLCASFRNAALEAHRMAAELRAQAEELTRAHGERERLLSELREADRRKDEFLAMLSHELRNPLAPIRTSVYILDRAEPGTDTMRRARAVIERQIQHLTRLVDDLLDVTRVSRGKIRLHRGPLDLAALVRRATEDHREIFSTNGVHLDVRVGEAPVHVSGDATRLTQVVGNLLQNAAKFTPRGGRATIVLETEGGVAVIGVHDTGAGIAPETKVRLFEPFVQGDRTLDRSAGGLGLGLSLVKALVELHDGTVSVESGGIGRGATFVVRLPLEGEPRSSPTTPALPEPTGAVRRVLLVDDNADAVQSLREALELSDHLVEVARSGPEGLAKARAFKPDVVLCDIGLPGMDGYAVARAFRADPELRRVSLVALSGYALPEDLDRTQAAGFDAHLAKPADVAAIERTMARVRGDAGCRPRGRPAP